MYQLAMASYLAINVENISDEKRHNINGVIMAINGVVISAAMQYQSMAKI
jgi:hypothetical protein